jgi:hypothetical protein
MAGPWVPDTSLAASSSRERDGSVCASGRWPRLPVGLDVGSADQHVRHDTHSRVTLASGRTHAVRLGSEVLSVVDASNGPAVPRIIAFPPPRPRRCRLATWDVRPVLGTAERTIGPASPLGIAPTGNCIVITTFGSRESGGFRTRSRTLASSPRFRRRFSRQPLLIRSRCDKPPDGTNYRPIRCTIWAI